MNFTIANNTLTNTWKRIRLPYVATACAVALAAGAVLSSGDLKEDISSPAARISRAVSIIQADETRLPMTYILVDTKAQAESVEESLGEHNALVLSGHQGLAPYEVVLSGSPAEARLLVAMAASSGENALNARIVDLRGQ